MRIVLEGGEEGRKPSPATPRMSIEEFVAATFSVKVWAPLCQPPMMSERPRIRSTFPITSR